MEIPTYLSHKPIVGVRNYDEIDAQYANKSDAKALSIGIAQYDGNEISAKVWRHSDLKRSRQSEELPLHRVFDLCALTLAAIMKDSDSHDSLADLKVEVINSHKLNMIKNYYDSNKEYLRPRIDQLEQLIAEFKEKIK